MLKIMKSSSLTLKQWVNALHFYHRGGERGGGKGDCQLRRGGGGEFRFHSSQRLCFLSYTLEVKKMN